jgi:hypothetical protein
MPNTNFSPMNPRCRSSHTVEIPDDFIDRYVEKHGGDGLPAFESKESGGLNVYKDEDVIKMS